MLSKVKFLLAAILLVTSISTHAGPDDTAYFNQLLFRKDDIGNDPDFPTYSYRFLMSKYNFLFQRDDGKYVNPMISVLLYPDGTYWMEYRENYLNTPDDTQFEMGPCKRSKGTWSVPNDKLELGDFAIGSRELVDGRNGISFSFTKNILSNGIMKAPMTMGLGFSDFDPRQPTFFCQ